MTKRPVTRDGERISSTAAISALSKEKLQMEAQRYQRGSLSLQKRKSLPDAWTFRYYVEEAGRRVYKKVVVGTVLQFPKRKDAEKAVAQLRVDINEGAEFAPMNIEQLAAHYMRVELPTKAPSTRAIYHYNLHKHILPIWGQKTLASIKPIEVENWIRRLKSVKGKDYSPAVKSKVRNQFHALFSHAIRYEWASRNPITPVRTSARRLRTPEFLDAAEFQALIGELSLRERVMVLLAGSTGIRRSELIALRWNALNFELFQANITTSVWRNQTADCKTEASRRPVPLHPFVIEQLQSWRKESLYKGEDDYIFPSVRHNGEHPIAPDMVLRRHIRPALKRLGIEKRIGWHSFRHGLGTMLRQQGVDLKTAQDLLRHANSRITMEIYQQSVSAEKRLANALVVKGLLGNTSLPSSSVPVEERDK